MGRGFRILSDRSGTVRESQSPLVKFRNKAFTGGTSLLPEALFNADSLRKAQDPVIFLRCHCAIECFNICHLRKRCILIHNANIDMIQQKDPEKNISDPADRYPPDPPDGVKPPEIRNCRYCIQWGWTVPDFWPAVRQ